MKTNLLDTVKDMINEDKNFVVAKIVKAVGSTPGKKGAWMIIDETGKAKGTVGGGLLEEEAKAIAKQVWRTKESYTKEFILDEKVKDGLDMRCGGNVCIRFDYIDEGNRQQFLDEFKANCVAYIFGGGHVGQAVEPVLRYVGFDTVVIDDREMFSNQELFPNAKKVITVSDYKCAFENINTDVHSYIIIVTRGHKGDCEVLRQSLNCQVAYIGMIGSRKKVLATFEALKKEGVSEVQLKKVHSPIGLSIGAESPQEIAISIVAEMIAIRANHE